METFISISVLAGEETKVHRETNQLDTSHWQILSQRNQPIRNKSLTNFITQKPTNQKQVTDKLYHWETNQSETSHWQIYRRETNQSETSHWQTLSHKVKYFAALKEKSGFAPGFVNYKKGCTRLAVASDKVVQLLAHGRWSSPGTPASSTTKTGRHDIAEILLKVALNTKNQRKEKIAGKTMYEDSNILVTSSNWMDKKVFGIAMS